MKSNRPLCPSLYRRTEMAIKDIRPLLGALIVFGVTSAAAQMPIPTATPASTVAPDPGQTPVPSPVDFPSTTPTPTPDDGSPVTIVPGVPDAATQANYRAAHTLQASITLSTTPTTSTSLVATDAAATAATTLASATTLKATGGVFNSVHLSAPSKIQGTSTSNAATTGAASTPPVVTIVLAYSASCTGQLVSVQPLNGGTLSASGSDGKTVTAPADGFSLVVASDGTATFSYQPPAASGTYQVLTRLDNVTTTLPFLVPDPQYILHAFPWPSSLRSLCRFPLPAY